MRPKEVDLMDILCVIFVKIHFMEITSCTCICLPTIILAICAKGNMFCLCKGNLFCLCEGKF